MAENLIIPKTKNRIEKYEALIPQIEALIGNEKDLIANLANTAAALYQTFGFFWVGFYLIQKNGAYMYHAHNHDDIRDKANYELVLAPFQGPIACTRIKRGKGVCGTVWDTGKTIIVPDVEQFPGHIACNSASKSEIVVPLTMNDIVFGVLDIDSDQLCDFSETDKLYLEKICKIIKSTIK